MFAPFLSMESTIEAIRSAETIAVAQSKFQDFRHERVPEDVSGSPVLIPNAMLRPMAQNGGRLRMIVADLAERLFQEADRCQTSNRTIYEYIAAICSYNI